MMTLRDVRWLVAAALAVVLAGCGSDGDIEISADDNSVVNNPPGGGGGSTNPCASYVIPGTETLRQGDFDGTNCSYGPEFVDDANPLTVDLVIPFFSGVHIFNGTLAVGEDVITDGTITAPTGGDGPTLTIEPGNTLTWSDSTDYLLVNRGSQIVANGSVAAPITFTGFADAITGTADPEAVQLWGGVVINGNGITNKCSDTQRAEGTCNVLSEGKPSNYGGNDNAESSGVLRYVVVKHTGFEVVSGDELNGVTFNAVGSGTVVENLQTYSTFDDGIEFFGGAVDVVNFVGIYVRDDTIDYADGWVGSITNALVIHSGRNRGNRCIEGDNQGSDFAALPLTSPTVSNMTCITSGIDNDLGDSEGPLLRRGVASRIVNSIIYDGYGQYLTNGGGNECFELNNAPTIANAADGTTSMNSTLIMCGEPTKLRDDNDADTGVPPNAADLAVWVLNGNGDYPFNSNNAIESDTDAAGSSLARALGGPTCFYSPETLNADDDVIGSTFVDAAGDPIFIPSVGGVVVGAVGASDDWTANWTFGLDDLWIQELPLGVCLDL